VNWLNLPHSRIVPLPVTTNHGVIKF